MIIIGFICALSQLYFLVFIYMVLDQIEISRNVHKFLLSVSIAINFIIVLYAFTFFYLK
jgi:hypothetical protein